MTLELDNGAVFKDFEVGNWRDASGVKGTPGLSDESSLVSRNYKAQNQQ